MRKSCWSRDAGWRRRNYRNQRAHPALRRAGGGGPSEPHRGQGRDLWACLAGRRGKDHIGYMAQRFGLYQDLTVEENMVFYSDLFGITGEERDNLTAQLLRMTRMEPFRARQAGRLSGGMKQKLALMCTLLHRPQILFLDEPTNGVDPVSRRDFWAILYQLLQDEITIFMTTAYLDEAERCNRVGLMHRGKLIRCSAPDAMKREMGTANMEGAFIKAIHEAEGLERHD